MRTIKDADKESRMYRHVEDFLQGKQRQKEYCQEHGLSKDGFYYWLKKYQRGKGLSNKFIPVQVTTPEVTGHPVETEEMGIHYPNGVVVTLPFKMDIGLVKSLIGLK